MVGWAQMRPLLVAALLAADVVVLVALATARPEGWGFPFASFGVIFVGLVGFLRWSIAHRHDR